MATVQKWGKSTFLVFPKSLQACNSKGIKDILMPFSILVLNKLFFLSFFSLLLYTVKLHQIKEYLLLKGIFGRITDSTSNI